jgi:MinD-like ATPase involved in chromosome partitioning or flagellar assembly
MEAHVMQGLSSPSGEVITFYSYKGGVGRSLALVNVAWTLASNGFRVLAMDWDLEAPGLLRYFQPLIDDPHCEKIGGVLDLLDNYMTDALHTEASASLDVLPYVQSVHWDFPQAGYLDIIGAGRQDVAYAARVNAFPWDTFYQKLGGGAWLDLLKERLCAEYDYILIDSRSGVSDTNGICTVQLPDKLVVCFTLNNQSLTGTAQIAKSVMTQRKGAPLRIFPVPMRLERAEYELLQRGLQNAREQFSEFVPPDRQDYWSKVAFFYTPFYASSELLVVFGDATDQVDSLLASVERLTAELTDGRVTRAAPIGNDERQRVLALYRGVTI